MHTLRGARAVWLVKGLALLIVVMVIAGIITRYMDAEYGEGRWYAGGGFILILLARAWWRGRPRKPVPMRPKHSPPKPASAPDDTVSVR